MYFDKELQAIQRSNRFRERKLFDEDAFDLASNDYLGLATKKEIFNKAVKQVSKQKSFGPKASMMVNGYSKIHQKFENLLCKVNEFEDGIVVGSGFLANMALIESMVRKNDLLLIDEEYHASGVLATSLVQGEVKYFKHNCVENLKYHLEATQGRYNRVIIAIEGIYSMEGDIAPKEIASLADEFNALLLVDEAHSSGVIGKNLLGWFDHFNIKTKPNYIKMGTLGKAYGSYGAYILASKETISFLENRAKSLIYTTAPSLIDIAIGYQSLKYILKNTQQLKKKIKKRQQLVEELLGKKIESLILPIVINDNKKVLQIQEELKEKGYLVGAIRQPTVKKAIIRIITKIDIDTKVLKKVLSLVKP